jgi:hypothetical protein
MIGKPGSLQAILEIAAILVIVTSLIFLVVRFQLTPAKREVKAVRSTIPFGVWQQLAVFEGVAILALMAVALVSGAIAYMFDGGDLPHIVAFVIVSIRMFIYGFLPVVVYVAPLYVLYMRYKEISMLLVLVASILPGVLMREIDRDISWVIFVMFGPLTVLLINVLIFLWSRLPRQGDL